LPDAVVMRGIRKAFGRKVAVDAVDLVVPEGGMVGLIGPNGAGKTTGIRMIMSIIFPDRGELEVLGRRSASESKDRIGYLPEERGVYKKMKVRKFLRHMAALKGLRGPDVDERITAWLERVELPGVAGKKCEELSKGMQQKVQFIASVIHDPDLLILDEPFSGLDPVNMRLLRELIREQHQKGVTVLFSTHVMVHAEQVCDHIVMIHDGRKVLDGSMQEIRARHDTRRLIFEPADPAADPSRNGDIEGVANIRRSDNGWEADVEPDADPTRAIAALASTLPVSRVEVHRPTLEDIFIEIVGGGPAAEGQTEAELRAAVRAGGLASAQTEEVPA